MADPVLTIWDEDGAAQVYSITYGQVEEGFESSPLGLRVYNNKDGDPDIADAENVRLCAVDDHTVQPVTYDNTMVKDGWMEAMFLDYDGNQFFDTFGKLGGALGLLKKWFDYNNSVIEGSSGTTETHYASFQIKVVVPAETPRGTYLGSPVVEYTVS